MSQLNEYISQLEDKPLASSLNALISLRSALSKLSDPDQFSTESIKRELVDTGAEFYAFLFQQAGISPSENIDESLQTAIGKLGFNSVKKLLFFHIAYSSESQNGTSYLDKQFAAQLWSLNYSVAATSAHWAGFISAEKSDEIFYLGMFQNIGISAFAQLEPSKHRALRESQRKVPLAIKETEHFGVNHYDLGAAIVERWGLPLIHRAAMRYEETNGNSEDQPNREEDRRLFLILYHAKHKNEQREYGQGVDRQKFGFDPHFNYDLTLLKSAIAELRVLSAKGKKSA